ncbi:hypothetical protein [Streptomyces sp. NPDC059757]|uniref:hypothetical protein n=1 Tax=Streptomyces sp. NPDC059757 TaxID=3346935 RepID=UPI00365D9DD0
MTLDDRTRERRPRAALVWTGAVTAGAVTAFILWAPIERAELVVSLISPVLAAVLAALAVEWWKRRRT